MKKTYLPLCLCLLPLLVLGCNYSKMYENSLYNGKSKLSYEVIHTEIVDASKLCEDEEDYHGPVTSVSARVKVKYHRGLEEQAKGLVEIIDQLIFHVEEKVGLSIKKCEVCIFLLRTDSPIKLPPLKTALPMSAEIMEFFFPVYVETGRESLPEIISANCYLPFVFIHELIEASLVYPETKPFVLPDAGRIFRNNTRWFRDGLANYAGYLACNWLGQEYPEIFPQQLAVQRTGIFNLPFLKLHLIGDEIFTWVQSDEVKYYESVLGLFLLLEQRYGPEIFPEIMDNLRAYEKEHNTAINGKMLLKVFNETLRLNLRQLVREFSFPILEGTYQNVTPALALNHSLPRQSGIYVNKVKEESIAEKAGIQNGDVITKLSNRQVRSFFELQLALLQEVEAGRQTVSIEINRQGQVHSLTLDISNKQE